MMVVLTRVTQCEQSNLLLPPSIGECGWVEAGGGEGILLSEDENRVGEERKSLEMASFPLFCC